MIVVTGATGLLGSHLVYELVKAGRPVRAMYRDKNSIAFVKRIFSYYSADADKLAERIEWVKGDVLDYYALKECMAGGGLVFHTAGVVSFLDTNKKEIIRINAGGTANVVNACMELGIGKLCFASSIAALGEPVQDEPVLENMLFNPGSDVSAYAISKFKAEMEVWRGIHEGLQAVIVNPSVIIGPGRWQKSIVQLIGMIKKGLRYYPAGSGGYVDVRDVARIMIILADSSISGERFIVNAVNLPHRELINSIAKELDMPAPDKLLTPFLMKSACIGEWIRSVFTGKPMRVNRRTFRISTENCAYSNQKIIDTIGYQFIPFNETVSFVVKQFLGDHQG